MNTTHQVEIYNQFHSYLDKLIESKDVSKNYELASKMRVLLDNLPALSNPQTNHKITQFQAIQIDQNSTITSMMYVLREDGTLWFKSLNTLFNKKWVRVETPVE